MGDETGEPRDEAGQGAEGGDDENASKLPFLPGGDDDTALGDTDQHSEASSDHDSPKR